MIQMQGPATFLEPPYIILKFSDFSPIPPKRFQIFSYGAKWLTLRNTSLKAHHHYPWRYTLH